MNTERTKRNPVTLRPIPWGKSDHKLGGAVCAHLVEATPPIVIQANPLKHVRIKRCLHHLGVTA